MNETMFFVVGALFLIATLFSLYRIVRGPAILDRIIASDMLVTTIICVLGAEMVFNGHTRSVPIMVVLALIAVFASITVSRYVSKRSAERRPPHRSPIARGREQ